jgi:hypothetical protein
MREILGLQGGTQAQSRTVLQHAPFSSGVVHNLAFGIRDGAGDALPEQPRTAHSRSESPRRLIEVEISLSEPLTGTSFGDLDFVPTASPDKEAP